MLCQEGPISFREPFSLPMSGECNYGEVYSCKSVSMSYSRANSYGMAYNKQVCQKSWVNSVKKKPLNRQSQILLSHLLKSKNVFSPKIGMLGVYPEAMAGNVGRLCSDFNLGERIWR